MSATDAAIAVTPEIPLKFFVSAMASRSFVPSVVPARFMASAKIIAEQTINVETGRDTAIDAMHMLKAEAATMKECVLKGDFNGIVDSMRTGWENKKKLARSISNSRIDEIYTAALAAGARAGKVSGAGGGGFMMFLVPLEHRMAVMRTLAGYEGNTSNCHFTKNGTQAWRI